MDICPYINNCYFFIPEACLWGKSNFYWCSVYTKVISDNAGQTWTKNLCKDSKTAVSMSYWQPFPRSERSWRSGGGGHPAVCVCVLPTSYRSDRSDSGGKRTSPVERGLARGWSCQRKIRRSPWLITSPTEPEVPVGGDGGAVLGGRNPF